MTAQEIKEALTAKVERRWADFEESLRLLTVGEIINRAGEIVCMEECREKLVSGLYSPESMAYLLKFENPLKIVAEAWSDVRFGDCSKEFAYVLWHLQDQGDAEVDYELDPKYLCPTSHEEAGPFYAQTPEPGQKTPIIGRVSFASGERIEYTDSAEYLKAVREELPYHATTGFRFKTLTREPEVRKAADDALYNLYGEENPRKLEEYQKWPDTGLTMGGM